MVTFKEITLPYGKTTQSISLPESHIAQVIEPITVPAVDVKTAFREAMEHPIGSKKLSEIVKPGDKVCLVTADITRAWSGSGRFMIEIVNALNEAGIPDEDMYIVFAQGTHRAHTDEENETVVGKEVARRIKMYQHDCHDDQNLTYVGTTSFGTPVYLNKKVVEADKTIIINGLAPHLFAGFGGGRKMILPGVAGWDTIQKNHCHALSQVHGEGINPATAHRALKGNPVNEDMVEGMEMCRPDFLIHSLINGDGEICGFVAGDPYEAWLEGTRRVLQNTEVAVKQKTDVTIVSAGGYPKDLSFYQGVKCFEPAADVTKDHGIIIALVDSPDIKEPKIFWDSFRFQTLPDMEQGLRDCFTIPFFIAFYVFTLAHNYTMYLVTRKENFEAVKKTHIIPCETLTEAWDRASEELARLGNKNYTINLMHHGGAVIPKLE
ncbi:MAG: nickel-dependent lactate racemase [Acidaminococcus sp.]|nr:nickel-dependent lactate racemase [Acidaminococcus sp.]